MTQRTYPGAKPCPFCGGAPYMNAMIDRYMSCKDCKATGPDATGHETPHSAWNRRAPPVAAPGDVTDAMADAFEKEFERLRPTANYRGGLKAAIAAALAQRGDKT